MRVLVVRHHTPLTDDLESLPAQGFPWFYGIITPTAGWAVMKIERMGADNESQGCVGERNAYSRSQMDKVQLSASLTWALFGNQLKGKIHSKIYHWLDDSTQYLISSSWLLLLPVTLFEKKWTEHNGILFYNIQNHSAADNYFSTKNVPLLKMAI